MQVSTLCSACSRGRLITDWESGEVICSNCGLVLSDKAVETRAEWRNFRNETNGGKTRVGLPTSLAKHDMGLCTVIGKTNKDAGGIVLNATMRSTINRLRTWQSRTQAYTSSDRNLLQAFDELQRLKDKLGLSDPIVEKTAYIYRKAQEKQLERGRTTSSILSACIYIACRDLDAPRTLKDISAISRVTRKSISRSCRLLIRELDIKVTFVDPIKCIAKIANKAGISEKTKRHAMDIMNDITETEIAAGKVPMGFAATVLYISCLNNAEGTTQKVIAEAAGVTEVTIRNRVKDLASLISGSPNYG
jgi:transcription initiation factor TFIIB